MPSSSAARVGLLATLLAAATGVAAEPIALLLSGPEPRVGVPALGPNTVPSHTARYEFGEHEVLVSYAATLLPVPDEWQELRCSGRTLHVSSPVAPFEVLVLDADALPLVLFEFPPGASAAVESWCPFAAQVVERFVYFQGFVEQSADLAFPAVIELSAPAP